MIESFGPHFQQAVDRLSKIGIRPRALVSIEIEVQALTFGPETGRKIGWQMNMRQVHPRSLPKPLVLGSILQRSKTQPLSIEDITI